MLDISGDMGAFSGRASRTDELRRAGSGADCLSHNKAQDRASILHTASFSFLKDHLYVSDIFLFFIFSCSLYYNYFMQMTMSQIEGVCLKTPYFKRYVNINIL